MSAIDRFDRDLGSWLEAEAPTTVPDGLHAALIERARRTRQRPRWSAWASGARLGGWPRPIDRPTTRAALYLLVALGLVLALVVVAIAVGSGLVRLSPIVPPALDATLFTSPPSPSTSPIVSPSPTAGLTPSVIGSGSWSVTGAPHHRGAGGATATLLRDGRVLVAGGDGEGIFSHGGDDAAELFDPATGQWTETGSLHDRRMGHVASLLADGRVLVAGGRTFSLGMASAELYDPATGQWTETGSMTRSRYEPTSILLADGRVLVIGGQTSRPGGAGGRRQDCCYGVTKGAETYDPQSGTWSWARAMTAPPATATLLPDGTVLVTHAGGSSELFDPRSGRWTATASATQAVDSPRATLLANGDVLLLDTWDGPVRGGGCPCRHFVGRAELYDPLTGSWTPTGSPPTEWGTAALLADGIALVFGADGAVRYDPQSGSWATVEAPPHEFLTTPPNDLDAAPNYWAWSSGIAIRLLDGRVLAVGDLGRAGDQAVAGAALFDPTGNP